MYIFKFIKVRAKIIILIVFTLGTHGLAGCSFAPGPAQRGTPEPNINKIVTATFQAMTQEALQIQPIPNETSVPVSEDWKTYSNPEYGFSIDYPSQLEITPIQGNTAFYLGEKIHI